MAKPKSYSVAQATAKMSPKPVRVVGQSGFAMLPEQLRAEQERRRSNAVVPRDRSQVRRDRAAGVTRRAGQRSARRRAAINDF